MIVISPGADEGEADARDLLFTYFNSISRAHAACEETADTPFKHQKEGLTYGKEGESRGCPLRS